MTIDVSAQIRENTICIKNVTFEVLVHILIKMVKYYWY